MKTIRRFFVQDAPVRRFTRDARLDAISPGKILVLGSVWQGGLKATIDDYLEAVADLVTPLTLNPSLIPGAVDLGKRWTGELRGKIRDGVITSTSGADLPVHAGYVSAAELVAEAEKLHEIMSSPLKTSFPVSDVAICLRRLRRASDAVSRTFPSPTRDSRPRGVIGYSTPRGNGSRAITPQMVMDAATKFWRERAGTSAPTRDAPSAKTMTAERLNQLHADFWAARAR